MPSVVVTGSNRGLGLEWVRQYAEADWRVYATCRRPQEAHELQAMATTWPGVSVHRLDVTVPEEIADFTAELQSASLDLLINNAGVYFERWGKDRLGGIDYAHWQRTFEVNTLGPMRVTEALLAPLSRSERGLACHISSHMGSLADIRSANDYAYRSSKAALNASGRGLAHELAGFGIGLLILHPGWVRTRMGGDSAPYTATQSVSGMRALVDGFSMAQSGAFLRFDGVTMPW